MRDWLGKGDGFLARDIDGDGAITSGAELFGSETRRPAGGRFVDGFAALAALDVNDDGRVDGNDPGFASLYVWTDVDGDGVSAAAELIVLGATDSATLYPHAALSRSSGTSASCPSVSSPE